MNECSLNNGECSHDCENTDGSYQCTCEDGYTMNSDDDRTCDDVDECAAGSHHCSTGEDCVNTEGGYECVGECKYHARETSVAQQILVRRSQITSQAHHSQLSSSQRDVSTQPI